MTQSVVCFNRQSVRTSKTLLHIVARLRMAPSLSFPWFHLCYMQYTSSLGYQFFTLTRCYILHLERVLCHCCQDVKKKWTVLHIRLFFFFFFLVDPCAFKKFFWVHYCKKLAVTIHGEKILHRPVISENVHRHITDAAPFSKFLPTANFLKICQLRTCNNLFDHFRRRF